jgi:O-antigen ligase
MSTVAPETQPAIVPSANGSGPVATHKRQLAVPTASVLPAALFLCPLLTCISPRLTVPFVAILGFSLIGAALRSGSPWRELLPRRMALAAALLFAAYVALNATWSLDTAAGLGKAALLISLVLLSFVAVQAAGMLDTQILRRLALAFGAGAFLGALFLLFELCTDGLATRTAMNWIPALKSTSPKHVGVTATGEVWRLNLSKIDQNINLAFFHLWPALLALLALDRPRRLLAMILFAVVTTAVVVLSKHASSQVALAGSAIVVLLAWYWPRGTIRALAVLWCVLFLIVIPASFFAFQSGLHLVEWMPNSARARIIIWEFTAEQTLAKPVLGSGAESTPILSRQQKGSRERPPGFIYPRTLGHHAHNIYLHTWFELGAIGALLFATTGAAVILLILILPRLAQPFAAGSFAAFALVGASAWGMWQSWFMCAVALLPIYIRVTAAAAQE